MTPPKVVVNILTIVAVALFAWNVSKGQTAATHLPAVLVDEKFDAVTPPNFPPDWTVDVPDIGGIWTWHTTAGPYNPSTPGAPSAPNVASFQSYNLPAGSVARLITPSLNWSSVTAPVFTFKFRRDVQYLSYIDRLFIDASTDNGATWTEVAGPYNRPTDVPGLTYWQDISVNVSAYAGQASVQFAFRAVSEYGNWIHIDNVFIGQPTLNDVGIVSITSPPASFVRSAQTVTASIKNFGTANRTAGSFSVHVKIWKTVGGSADSAEFNNVESGPAVASGATIPFSFVTQWTPLEYTGYTVKVYTELAGDESPANDTLTKAVTVLPGTDMQVQTIIYPPMTGLYTGTLGYGVKGRVKNNGTSVVTGADYAVEAWIGPTAGFPGSSTYHGTALFRPDIAPGATADIEILPAWVPVDAGAHTVRIKATLAGDEVPSNDSLDASRMVYSVHFGGPDSGGYCYATNASNRTPRPTYNWMDITGNGTPLNLTDDGNSSAISIPAFTLYGSTYTQLKVNNNGLIRFDTDPDQNYHTNLNIPNANPPDFFLAPFWDDLAAGSATGGNVYYRNNPSDSVFIIEYYRIARLGEEANPNTFEVVIDYATGSIYFQYNDMPGNTSACTIGIEGNGSMGTQWLYDGSPTPAAEAIVNGRVIWFGTDTTATHGAVVGVDLSAGWNMISNPVARPAGTDSVRHLYPHSLFPYVFSFSPGGFTQTQRMPLGPGFWGKFPAPEVNSIAGTSVLIDSVDVVSGWNIIGSITLPVDTQQISSIPAGLRASNWFGYSGGYDAVNQLMPGKAYWIKAAGPGIFILNSSAIAVMRKVSAGGWIAGELNSITISDGRGGSQTLRFGPRGKDDASLVDWGMPPRPPAGAFDARFESEQGGLMVLAHPARIEKCLEFPIAVQTDADQVTVAWNIVTAGTYSLADAAGGLHALTGQGTLEATRSLMSNLTLKVTGGEPIPKDYTLRQNYPNPFNPVTTIGYALPKQSHVKVTIYDVLGQEVKTLLDEVQDAGYQSVEWNSTNNYGAAVGSGVFFCRLEAGDFVSMRKMLLLK